MNMHIARRAAVMLAVTLALSGCRRASGGAEAAAPVPVSVVAIVPVDVALFDDLPGRVSAYRRADVRAQIGGIVRLRLFSEGTDVRAGQPMFQIDPAPFKADVDVASAALQRAQATLAHTQVQAARLSVLAAAHAISAQVYDDAVAQRDQAAADVAQTRATLQRRQLDLQFTTVAAPIGGRVDASLVSEGALAGASDVAPLARIEQIDKVYVDVRQSAALPLRVRAPDGTPVRATILNGGVNSGIEGTLQFSGVTVDAGTSEVMLRILVDNARRTLLPGMFVHARMPRGTYRDALMVPQQAVTRTGANAQLWIVDAGNRARRVDIELGELTGRQYRIARGISAGDRVVVQGIDRLAEGGAVRATVLRTASAPVH